MPGLSFIIAVRYFDLGTKKMLPLFLDDEHTEKRFYPLSGSARDKNSQRFSDSFPLLFGARGSMVSGKHLKIVSDSVLPLLNCF